MTLNEYKDSMEKIKLSDDAKQRIARNMVSRRKSTSTRVRFLRPAACFAAGVMLCLLSVTLIRQFAFKEEVPDDLIATYGVTDFATVDELRAAADFEIGVPEYMPEGWALSKISLISGEVAELVYTNGTNRLTFRTAEGGEDCSGVYPSSVETEETVETNAGDVNLKSGGDVAWLAVWTDENRTDSIYLDGAAANDEVRANLSREEILNIINSVK